MDIIDHIISGYLTVWLADAVIVSNILAVTITAILLIYYYYCKRH